MIMKTILYMTLTATGQFVQADEAHPIPQEILADFGRLVGKTGNLIVGRRTYDLMHAQLAGGGFSGIEVVVVSHAPLQAEGVSVAGTPREAVRHLEQKGFESALVGGGALLDGAFLSQGPVDEIYLNVEPRLASRGGILAAEGLLSTTLRLMGTAHLTDDIVQLHYGADR